MLHFGSFEIRTDVFLLLSALVLLGIQLLLCFKGKHIWLRLAPSVLCVAATLLFFVLIFVFDGWDRLGFLLLSLCAASFAAVCALGWGIWGIARKCRQEKG